MASGTMKRVRKVLETRLRTLTTTIASEEQPVMAESILAQAAPSGNLAVDPRWPFVPGFIRVKARPRDLTGQRFTLLVALKIVGKHANGSLLWHCQCDCGKDKVVPACRLTTKKVHSCGCYRSKVKSEWHKKNASWNKGKRYQTKGNDDHYASKKAWVNAVIFLRGNKCERCGWDKAKCDVHHKTPRSRGGKNTINNAVVICPNCHRVEHETAGNYR